MGELPMMLSRVRLRMSIDARKRKKEGDKPGTYLFRKKIHDRHAFAFLFLGMALNLNLDTSLLTEKVFHVENFANITLFLYFGTLIIAAILYMFTIGAEFYQLVASVWFLVLSRTSHLLLAFFAHGTFGRNMFLIFYTLNGFLRGVISLTSTYVISKFFLNEAYLHFLNGGVLFSILVSLLQVICDSVIGTETVLNARKSLIIAQSFYLIETSITAVWITVVYFGHGHNVKFENGQNSGSTSYGQEKFKASLKKFEYTQYYQSKLAIVSLASLNRVIFHPVMIPYMMEISYVEKLISSILFTIFEFLGRLVTFSFEEYIDPTKKSEKTSDQAFLALQDIHLYLLLLLQICLCGFTIWCFWFQRYGLSNSGFYIMFVTMTSGFIVGYTINRGVAGSQASLEFYADPYHPDNEKKRRQNGSTSSGGTGNTYEELRSATKDTSNVNDILTLAFYTSYLTACVFSYVGQQKITEHKTTFHFILNSKKDYLDKDSIYRLIELLKY